jgi:NTE family protein
LIARQLVNELEDLGPEIAYLVPPPLCPLMGSPYDFSRTAEHIERSRENTDAWIAAGRLTQREIPHELRPREH